ncbi:unnamed protein product [Litomosoides sigmodontis]|uniref:VPS37 C-terminal domain-containing protein n=1 Tax=Litomosoides sigmodontis TaxID=42156 RepID=A0A3P6UXA6_LITSI|nr:unnamed protein product [Litomosoides sigmodontis]
MLRYRRDVMVDTSYESLLDVCVSAAMTSIKNMNYDQVAELLNDDDDNKKIDEIVDGISQVRTLPTEREMGLVQNKSLAEWNLSQEPKIEEAKRQLRTTYEEAVKVKQEIRCRKKDRWTHRVHFSKLLHSLLMTKAKLDVFAEVCELTVV